MKKEDKEKCRESLKKNIAILREHATARRKGINERENTEYPLSDFWEWQMANELAIISLVATHSDPVAINKSQQRKYSLEELDEMRSLIANWADYWMIMKSAEVEDRLRTTMMNGTSIEEMREWAKKKETEKKNMEEV